MVALSHHAYFFEGSLDQLDSLADAACRTLGLTRARNPNVAVEGFDTFGIDESRELSRRAALRGAGKRSLLVIGVSQITSEAQQALLKLFEEPREGLIFILLAPHGSLLPTLRSRMLPFEIKSEILHPKNTGAAAHTFLAASPKERSDMLSKLLKESDAREQLRQLLNDMEIPVYKRPSAAKYQALEEIAVMRPYLNDRSPSLKMIFEHLAAVLPRL